MKVRRTIELYKGSDYFLAMFPIYVNRSIESFDYSEHRHDFLEISYVDEGSGTHYIGDTQLKVSKGDVFWIPVGVSHVFRPDSTARSKQLVVYNCVIANEALRLWLQSIPGGDVLQSMLELNTWQQYHDHREVCSHLFHKLYAEYVADRPGKKISLYITVMEILLSLHRLDHASPVAPSSQADGESMKAVLDYINDNFKSPLTQGQISSMLAVGERQCHRLFVKHTGMSLKQYVQSLRINEACRLLRTTDRKVSDIALEVAYRDVRFFNQLFKRKTGLTPREYRYKGDVL